MRQAAASARQAIEQENEHSLDAVIEKKDGILKTAMANETKMEKVVTGLSKDELGY